MLKRDFIHELHYRLLSNVCRRHGIQLPFQFNAFVDGRQDIVEALLEHPGLDIEPFQFRKHSPIVIAVQGLI